MKKIIIAGCVAVFASISYAASVNWSAATANPGPESAAGQYVYLAYFSASADLATTITIAGNGADAIGGTTDNGGNIVAWHLLTGDEGDNGTFLDEFVRADSKGGVNGYYQIILADADNKKFAIGKAYNPVSGITDATGAGTVDMNGGWTTGDDYVGMNGFTGTITTSVPEPTSGLLLLIGVTGLALRRRRA